MSFPLGVGKFPETTLKKVTFFGFFGSAVLGSRNAKRGEIVSHSKAHYLAPFFGSVSGS